jgi:VIT1/CCC1 family predicted Fe2+/Mn2+ transporter
MRYAGLTAEQVRAEISIYQNAVDASARTLIALTKVTSDEMLERINQLKAAMMSEALAGAIAEVGITGDQASELRRAYVRRLRVQPDVSDRRALPAAASAGADGALVGVVIPAPR